MSSTCISVRKSSLFVVFQDGLSFFQFLIDTWVTSKVQNSKYLYRIDLSRQRRNSLSKQNSFCLVAFRAVIYCLLLPPRLHPGTRGTILLQLVPGHEDSIFISGMYHLDSQLKSVFHRNFKFGVSQHVYVRHTPN